MKVLLVQVKRIGDLLLTTPVIKALKAAKPHCHITVIADSSAASLLPALGVDQTWTFERAGLLANLFRPSINPWIKSDLPFSEFAYCLDFTGTDRSALVAVLAGGSKRVTYERFRKKFLRPQIYQQFVDSPVRLRHTADHHTDLLRPLGIEVENVPMELSIPDLIYAEVRAKLETHDIEGAYAVVHPGTARPEKYWEPDRWAQVIKFLRSQYGLTTILTGSSEPGEQNHIAAIKAALKLPCVDLSGQTDLLELATVISGARFFGGVDTAAMHLSDAFSIPSVALFGPTNPFQWRPRNPRSAVVRADTEEPFTPDQKGGPMSDIAVPAVLKAIERVLD